MNFKILNTIGKVYTEEAKEILNKLGDVNYLDLTQEEFIQVIEEYDILVVGLGLKINKEVLSKAKKLKVIATATTGLDHIDLDYAEAQGIEVISLRGENEFLDTITGTAELSFGLMIDLMRFTHGAFRDVQDYKWDREKWRGHNLSEKTLGIVGMGRLGKMMAHFGSAFGMNIIFFDPNIEQESFPLYKKVSFTELVSEGDVISIHVHLSEDTENMFGKQVFEKMKNSALLINTSRGKIVNEYDLLKAIKNNEIAGYGTDVLADELDFDKGFSDHPMVEYSKNNNNLIIVPHIGGMTYESREKTDVFIAEKIERYLKSKNKQSKAK